MKLEKTDIKLAQESEIKYIIEIIKERCIWFAQNNIEQWDESYYTDLYNEKYFKKNIKTLYVVKEKNKIIGAFLLKNEDNKYWKDRKKACYIHQLVTKIGYPGLGSKILEFIKNLAIQDGIDILRLDCVKDNIKLNKYYQEHGFQSKGEGQKPYPHRLWEKQIKCKNQPDILNFYKQTSPFTDLGYYKNFAKKLSNDIEELCVLQRMQIIHPFAFIDKDIRNKKNCFWGDMTKVPITRLRFEDDIFPTAQSVLAELLRKNPNYDINREAKDKVHVTCRSQAILLASILKAKGIPARVRSGFAEYIHYDGIYYDHWITEYFNEKENRWQLVDADEHCPDHEMGFDLNNIPYDKFLFGAKAYLGIRENTYKEETILYSSDPVTLGLKAAIRGLFYDFHSLMNNEIIFLHMPKYIRDKNFELSEEEYQEFDNLAKLMLNPNDNFNKLLEIWENVPKFRIMSGALN